MLVLFSGENSISQPKLLELGLFDDFRTPDWLEVIVHPELVYQKTNNFLRKMKYLH